MLRLFDEWPNDTEEETMLRHRVIETTRQLQVVLSQDPQNGFPRIRNYFLSDDNVIGHVPQKELELYCNKLNEFHKKLQ